MHITKESLELKAQSLRDQQAQGLALFNQASGALQLIDALKAEISDALSEKQLTDMIEGKCE
jgi:hypothetical protein